MANLINMIPVSKPQTQQVNKPAAPVVQKPVNDAFSQLKNPYPQIKTYEYIPARPLSEVRTAPKGSRPVAASGKIINENIFQSAASTVKSYGQYAKNLYNAAFKGEGNDYKVGKINDLSIRAGSLGIASILATTKFFPFAKGMEFVGLGTWFAAMAVWPRIIGAPIKAITGVDINQKYVDSEHRRKSVFEDNLYRPMDLYRHLDEKGKLLSKEDYYKKYQYDYIYLEKLGDKLGIPKEQKNRNEATMNKMGQVAVQGRTLSMMTAGIMTPVLSSVVADALQYPVKSAIESSRYNKHYGELKALDEVLIALNDSKAEISKRKTNTNIDTVIEKLGVQLPQESWTEFSKIVDSKDYLNEAEFKKLKSVLNEITLSSGLQEPVERYLEKSMSFTEPKVSLGKELHQTIQKAVADAVKTSVEKMNPDFAETLPDEVKNYAGISEKDFLKAVKSSFANEGENYAKIFGTENPARLNIKEVNSFENVLVRKIRDSFKNLNIDEDAVEMIAQSAKKNIKNAMDSQKQYVIAQDKDRLKLLFKFVETNKFLGQKIAGFKKATIANVAESMTATNWENLPQKYLDVVGFTKEQIAQIATMDSSQASKIITKRFEQIAADPKLYEKTLKSMSKLAAEAINREEKAALALIGTIEESGVITNAKDLMEAVGNFNFGSDMEASVKSVYSNLIKDIQYKLRNTTDSFVRPIKALDTFKYLEEGIENILGKNAAQYGEKLKNPHYYMFVNMDYETAKQSLKTFIKDIVLDKNDINNWTTKFEHDLPNGKKGMKHSLELVQKIADIVNGSLHHDTEMILDATEKDSAKTLLENKKYKEAAASVWEDSKEFVGKYWKKLIRVDETKSGQLKFSQKCNLNNAIMRSRFLNIEYKLAKDFSHGTCYMKDYTPTEALLKEIMNGNLSKLYLLEGFINERREQLTLPEMSKLKQVRDTVGKGYKYEIGAHNAHDVYENIFKKLDFGASNKEIAEMSGKNIADFFANAAQNYRSRNKWVKAAYGLLLGTTAVTAFAISRIGKNNHFNNPKVKNHSQGALR